MISRVILAVHALAFAGIGLWTLIDPLGPLRDVGVAAVDDRGVVELRAMYGGLELGLAAFLAWSLLDSARVRGGLLAGTLAIGGLGVVRLAAWSMLLPPGNLLPILAIVELSGAVAGVVGLALGARRR